MTRKLASRRPFGVHRPASAARSAGRFSMSLVSCLCRKSRASAPVTASNPYRFSRAHSIVECDFTAPKLLKTLFGFVVLVSIAVAGYGAWYLGTPVKIRQYPVEVEIPRGSGFRAALEQLEKSGVGVRPYEFEILARAMGKVRDIKAGSYEISQPLTPTQLLDKLTRGDVTQAELRLIEGWTFAQFRAALDASPDLRHDTKGLEDAQILARLQAPETHPEGLFFPDTYLFGKGSSDFAVLRRSYRAMQRHLKEEWEARDTKAVPYRTPYEALIMASIVEK